MKELKAVPLKSFLQRSQEWNPVKELKVVGLPTFVIEAVEMWNPVKELKVHIAIRVGDAFAASGIR